LAIFWGVDDKVKKVELKPADGLRVAGELFELYCAGAVGRVLGHVLNCTMYACVCLDVGPMRGEGEARIMRLRQFEFGDKEGGKMSFSRSVWKTRRDNRVRFGVKFGLKNSERLIRMIWTAW